MAAMVAMVAMVDGACSIDIVIVCDAELCYCAIALYYVYKNTNFRFLPLTGEAMVA